jgi:ribosomal peptide maturation radical SAM protein 1
MPWAAAVRPSIQCGLLKAILERHDHSVDVHYLNAEMASELGAATYDAFAEKRRNDLLLGEWLFSIAAFGDGAPRDLEAFRLDVRGLDQACEELGFDLESLGNLRATIIPKLVDHWADSIDWSPYSTIGFTSTFEQTVGSLALASRLKERHPDIKMIFGGANFDGEMGAELVTRFEQIDYAVVGEGDRAIVDLVAAISWGDNPLGIEGVIGRHGDELVTSGRAPNTEKMDELPPPDYDDFFKTLDRLGHEKVAGQKQIVLPFESARGCWWGQKHHCTFCGLNGDTMTYRSKPAKVVADELRMLSSRYRILKFEAVDNIMDMFYLPNMLKQLAEEPWDYSIFYEVKANLRRDQLKLMSEAGITSLQPGIESLSTNVLKLMRKGTTVLNNVRLLKWALHYNISIQWNLIMGFPSETIEDYETQLELMPKLYHLQPAGGSGPIWLERFSPFFNDPDLGLVNAGPKAAYRHVWPEAVDIDRIAYFFDSTWDGEFPDSLYRHTAAAVTNWQQRWSQPSRPVLAYERAPEWMHILDTRDADEAPLHIYLDHDESLIYEACGDREISPAKVAAALADQGIHAADKIRVVLDDFCEQSLMITEDDNYLALALPVRAK